MLGIERDGAITTLTLDRPERRNAVGMPLRREMIAAFDQLDADPDIRGIVLTGAGGDFSAGGDIDDMTGADLTATRERFRVSHQLVRLMVRLNKPIIAAVEGWCVGAGVSLVLCCDTVVAARGARFRLAFEKLGLIGDLGILHTLPQRVGPARARQFLLHGMDVSAEEAQAIGLVDRLVEKGEALAAARALARGFETAAPLAAALTKAILARGLDELLDIEREVQAALQLTADHAEAKAAFKAKRPPRFAGR